MAGTEEAVATAAIQNIQGVARRIAFLEHCLTQERDSVKAANMQRLRAAVQQAAYAELRQAIPALCKGELPYYVSMLHQDPVPAEILVTTSTVQDEPEPFLYDETACARTAKIVVDEDRGQLDIVNDAVDTARIRATYRVSDTVRRQMLLDPECTETCQSTEDVGSEWWQDYDSEDHGRLHRTNATFMGDLYIYTSI
jgi:hypothetical protein